MHFTVLKYTINSPLVNQQKLEAPRDFQRLLRLFIPGRRPAAMGYQTVNPYCKKYADGIGQQIVRIGSTAGDETLVEFIGQTVGAGKQRGPNVGPADSRGAGPAGESPNGQQSEKKIFDTVGQFIEESDIQPGIGQARKRRDVEHNAGV